MSAAADDLVWYMGRPTTLHA